MSNIWAAVSTIVHLPRMFPPTDCLLEKKRIGLVTIYLLYIILTHYTQDNQQECYRPSNRFSLFEAVDEPLASSWWPNLRFMFLNESWCVSLTKWKGSFYLCLLFIIALYIAQILPLLFLSYGFTLYYHFP